MKTKKYIAILLTLILSLIYLLSGIAKAADINGFADIINQYGVKSLYKLTPILTFLEIMLGFLFLLFWNIRFVSILSAILILALSLFYLGTFIFMDIENCGCFGSFYEFPFWLTILRNAIMIFISIWLNKNYFIIKNNKLSILKPIIAICLGFIAFIIISIEMNETYYQLPYNNGQVIENTFLEKYGYNNSKEKLIFIFSPNCEHCQSAMPIVNNLAIQNIYHEIIGLYPLEYQNVIKDFSATFTPSFKLEGIPNDSITKIAKAFPLFVIIKKGEIKKITNKIPVKTID